ncbi:hypothetical protein V8G54_025077 [Vigna mungo]|uniref:Uncharacterized protein n=1 Tax=Vigna mungo TaxID=3915 RepID=A0AAQ3N7X5_VIGMU
MIDNLHNLGGNYKTTKTNSRIVVQSLCNNPHKRNMPEKKPFITYISGKAMELTNVSLRQNFRGENRYHFKCEYQILSGIVFYFILFVVLFLYFLYFIYLFIYSCF